MISATVNTAVSRLAKYTLYGIWQILPLDLASGLGALLARIIALRYHRTTAAARKALLQINPAYGEHELDHILSAMWQNMGRVWAEALITHRLARQRLKITGLDNLESARATGRPIILPFVHTGNWEISTPVLAAHNLAPHVSAETQRRKIFEDLINRVRQANGMVVLSTDISGIRKIYQCLKQGATLCIAMDEYKNGKVMGPGFNRKLEASNNLDFALRLAKKYSAVLLPMHVSRRGGANFELHIAKPISTELTQSDDDQASLKGDLEQWCERTIREHIDQWYMLHRLRFG